MEIAQLIFQYSYTVFGCILAIGLFSFLKIPTPALLGPLLYFTFLNLYGLLPIVPTFWVALIGQFFLGTILATRFTRRSLLYLKEVPLPLFFATSTTFLLAIASGFAFYFITGKDLTSSIIGTAPGGFAEMVALGFSLNADTVLISFIQIMRLLCILILVPLVLKFMKPNKSNEQNIKDLQIQENQPLVKKELIPLFALNIVLCLLFYTIKVPAAIIMACLFGSISYLLIRNKSLIFPIKVQYFAHSCIALATATSITSAALLAFSSSIIPLIIILIISVLGGFLQGLFLCYLTKWDRLTCYLSCISGGLSQMALTAQEMNANVPLVIFFHLIRLVSLILFWPILIEFII